MSTAANPALVAIQNAWLALKNGDQRSAQRWAERAARLAPKQEDPWLILAALAEPHASPAFLKRALDINPQSPRAHEGMRWAMRRLRSLFPATIPGEAPPPPAPRKCPTIIAYPLPSQALVKTRPALLPWLLVLIALAGGILAFVSVPILYQALASSGMPYLPIALAEIPTANPSLSIAELPTANPTPIPTVSPTPLPTDTPIPLPSDTPTSLPAPLPTDTPFPTLTPVVIETLPEHPTPVDLSSPAHTPAPVALPEGTGLGERWIDVDLSAQRAFAYEGDALVRSFLVSTGTSAHPTIRGQFYIYVKYRYAPMSGPGYYLPNVPYVMYFYKGYGLHGTYWHHNFGHPMSHGCINFKTSDAGWLFEWASIGTLVNIHR